MPQRLDRYIVGGRVMSDELRAELPADITGMTKRYRPLPTRADLTGLDPDAAAAVAAYTPVLLASDDWLAIRDRALELVAILAPCTVFDARRTVRLIAVYLAELADQGHDVHSERLDVLFDPIRVDDFIHTRANSQGAPHELRYYRHYGHALNPGGGWPVTLPVTTRSQRQDPYSADEERAIAQGISVLRRGKYRDVLTVVTNVVLGCGMGTSELVDLDWSAFAEGPHGTLLAKCPGGPARAVPLPPRVVPVAEPYRHVVARLAATRTGPVVAAGDVNTLAQLIDSASRCMGNVPKVLITRLRTTWMVHRARAGVPWPDLATAAGIQLESLVRALAGHVDPAAPETLMSAFTAEAP